MSGWHWDLLSPRPPCLRRWLMAETTHRVGGGQVEKTAVTNRIAKEVLSATELHQRPLSPRLFAPPPPNQQKHPMSQSPSTSCAFRPHSFSACSLPQTHLLQPQKGPGRQPLIARPGGGFNWGPCSIPSYPPHPLPRLPSAPSCKLLQNLMGPIQSFFRQWLRPAPPRSCPWQLR
jgi:hypothetical protein